MVNMKRRFLCFLTYFAVSPVTLFAQTNPGLDESGFGYWYSHLKQAGLAKVRESCVMGKKFNGFNVSYWDNIVINARIKDRELDALKNNLNLKLVEIIGRDYDSAMIAAMKEICPEVW